jgi:hypothetical protein
MLTLCSANFLLSICNFSARFAYGFPWQSCGRQPSATRTFLWSRRKVACVPVSNLDGFMCIFFSFASFLLKKQKKDLAKFFYFSAKKSAKKCNIFLPP